MYIQTASTQRINFCYSILLNFSGNGEISIFPLFIKGVEYQMDKINNVDKNDNFLLCNNNKFLTKRVQ
jgi:hypothetical protein